MIVDQINRPTLLDEHELGLLSCAALTRLQRIAQLEFASQVFPGATHTRYAHTIGVHQLSLRVLESSAADELTKQPDTVGKWDAQAAHAMLRVAAILHDMGHGPYSHWSERLLLRMGLPKPKVGVSAGTTERSVKLHEWLAYAVLMVGGAGEDPLALIGGAFPRLFPDGAEPDAAQNLVRLIEDRWDSIAGPLNSWIGHMRARQKPAARDSFDRLFIQRVAETIIGSSWGVGEFLYGDADIDRLDYLIRDSASAGVAYGLCEADRLLTSGFGSDGAGRPVVDYGRGLAALEHSLVGRSLMRYVVHLHPVAVQTGEVMTRICEPALMKRQASSDSKAKPLMDSLAFLFSHDDSSLVHWLRETSEGADLTLLGLAQDRRLYKKIALIPWQKLSGRLRSELEDAERKKDDPAPQTTIKPLQGEKCVAAPAGMQGHWAEFETAIGTRVYRATAVNCINANLEKVPSAMRDSFRRLGFAQCLRFEDGKLALPAESDEFRKMFGPPVIIVPPVVDDGNPIESRIVTRRGLRGKKEMLQIRDISSLLPAIGELNLRGTYLLVLLHPWLHALMNTLSVIVSDRLEAPPQSVLETSFREIEGYYGLTGSFGGWGDNSEDVRWTQF